jgi:hypothetical protein
MKARTALAAILALATAGALTTTSALAKPPRHPAVHSYILLDRTGSMEPIWNEALSSVNAYADGLAALDGGPRVDADITLAVFDAQDGLQFDVLRQSVDAGDWNDVTTREVNPRGMTPLYDAIGRIVSLAEFSNFDDAEGVGQSSSRNMAVSKDQLSDSMDRLAQKSKNYASGAAPSVEWNEEDRAAAKEEEVKQRTGGNNR